MDFEKESLGLLLKTAVKAEGAATKFFTVPGEPPGVYYTVGANGELEKQVADRQPFCRTVSDVPSLVRFLAEYKTDKILDDAEILRQIWIGDRGIVAMADINDKASLTIPPSEPFAMLCQWAKDKDGVSFTQKELWKLIRTKFRGCLPAHANLAELVGKVDIKKAQEAAGVVTREKTSMSRSMVAEASGANKLPEVLEFKVPLFERKPLDYLATIKASFDLDAEDETFDITILPGEIDAAIAGGREYLWKQVNAAIQDLDESAGTVTKTFGIYFGTL